MDSFKNYLVGLAFCLCIVFLSCKNSNTFNVALLGKIEKKYDPILLSEINETTFLSQTCIRLTTIDQNLNIQPDLALRWTLSKDKKTISFQLRKAFFFGGRLIESEDVYYSFKRLMSLDSMFRNLTTNIKSIHFRII